MSSGATAEVSLETVVSSYRLHLQPFEPFRTMSLRAFLQKIVMQNLPAMGASTVGEAITAMKHPAKGAEVLGVKSLERKVEHVRRAGAVLLNWQRQLGTASIRASFSRLPDPCMFSNSFSALLHLLHTVAGSGSKLSVAYIVVAAEAFEIGAQVMNAHEIVWQPRIHTATL